MPALTRNLRRLFVALAGCAALPLAAGGGVYAWLQTDGGRDWARRQAEAALSTPGGNEIAIESLTGSLPQSLQVSRLTARDPEGIWLRVEGLVLDWRPLALLRGRFEVARLRAGTVEISRTPAAAAAAEDGAGFAPPELPPELPVEVVVEQLAVEALDLAPAILGEPAGFRIAGRSRAQPDGALDAWLTVERRDDGRSGLTAEAAYRPAGERLALSVTLSEPQGGLAAHLLDLPGRPAVDLKLEGAGPLRDWRGGLTVRFDGLLDAEAQLFLRKGAEIAFGLDAEARVTPPSQGPPWPLLAGRQVLNIEGQWRGAEGLNVSAFTLRGAALEIEGRGDLEEDEIEAELTARLRDGAPLARWIGAERLEDGRAVIALGGRLSKPRITADLRAARLTIDKLAIRGLRVQAAFQAEDAFLEVPPSGRLSVDAGLEDLELRDEPELQAVIGRSFALGFEGALDLAAPIVTAERLTVASEAFEAEVAGRLRLDDGQGEMTTRARYFTLSRLDSMSGLGLKGSAEIEGPWKIEGFGSRLGSELRGRLLGAGSEVEVIADLLSAETKLEAKLRLGPDGVALRDVKVDTKAAEVTGELAVLEDDETLSGTFRLALPEAGVLSDALGVRLEGPGAVSARLGGRSSAPELSGTVTAAAVQLQGFGLSRLSADYRTARLTPEVAGRVEARANSPLGALAAATDLKIDDRALHLTALEVTAPEGKVSGALAAPLEGGPLAGTLSASFRDLGGVLAIAGLSGGGRGDATVNLTSDQGRQAARLDGVIEQASLAAGAIPVSAKRVAIGAQSGDLAAGAGRFELRGRGLRRAGLALDDLTVLGEGGPRDLAVTLQAEGRWLEDLAVTAAGRLGWAEGKLDAELTRAEGRALGDSFRLSAPARLTLGPDSVRLRALEAEVGPGRLSAAAAIDTETLSASLTLDKLPARLADLAVPLGLTGDVSAEAEIDGPRAALEGRFSVEGSGLRTARLAGAPASEVALSGTWRDGRLALDGRLRAAEAAEARLAAELPLRIRADDLAPELPSDQPIEGRLTWKGEAARLLAFMPLADHRFEGSGDIALALQGTLAAPRLDGRIALAGGEYESLETGALLKDLELRVELRDESARLARFSATDGGAGAISAQGRLAFAAEAGFPYELSAEIENFHLARRDDVTASVSGQVRLEGDAQAGRLSGALVTDRVEIGVIGALPPEVVALDVVEENGRVGTATAAETTTRRRAPYDLALALTLEMPQEVFVRGRGLDSEWSGSLGIRGTAGAPLVSGEAVLVRGRLSVVGKPFDLVSGVIRLPKDAEPELDVVARHETGELTVTAKVTGALSQPEIALSSEPALPPDEMVSRVLFNKGVANLTAIEAAQLATALPELTGRGAGGLDVLGLARRMLGVDVLQIETVEGEKGPSPAVSAGKYVTEKVFLGVKQGATPESGAVGVEVELTPNISVESEVTRSGASKSGLKFKLDY